MRPFRDRASLRSRPLLATRFRITALLLALAALALSACGGDDDGGGASVSADTDAQQVLDQALGGGDPIESGVLDLSFKLDSTKGEVGSVEASVKGPFASNGDGELPDLDFDIDASAEVGGPTLSFAGGLILTGDGLWVNYQDQSYQLDEATFARVEDSYAKSAALQEDEGSDDGSLSQFGIDPLDWLTDVTNEGTEDIDGTETVHISGRGDIDKIVSDLDAVARKSGQEQLGGSDLDQLESAIAGAEVDVYAAADDGSLRRIDIALDLAGGAGSVAISAGIADPNSDQSVTAPEQALPLGDLIGQFLGATGVGDGSTDGGSTGGDAGGTGDAGDAYYQCVQQARTPGAVSECAQLLQ